MENVILSMEHITKIYPGVRALNDVSVEFKKGEVHALMGENGAGKSTLIKTLSGAIAPDSGTIILEGSSYNGLTPHKSRELGIGVVYQEFNLFPELTVYENIFMGNFRRKNGFVDHQGMIRQTAEMLDELGLKISPTAKIKDLSVGYMQLVEISKVLFYDIKILVLDEPTAPLTTNETNILFGLIKKLKEQGVTVIYISHRLNEVFDIADRVTVLRDGSRISTHSIEEITRDSLIKEMVGRSISDEYPARSCPIGETVLKVTDLFGNGARHISFELHKGEVLGMAGLVGAGRTETARMIFGADPLTAGTIELDGEIVHITSPKKAVELGMALIPEDRKSHGALLELSISDNMSLAILPRLSKLGIINQAAEKKVVDEHIEKLRVKTPSPEQKVKNLSGGNQQKVILGKWLASNSKVILFDEPTRGIDVGAKQEIYKLINSLCEQGVGILMISSDMEEIIRMSDRILVLSEGSQMAILNKEEFTQEKILSYASGNK